MIRSFNNFSYNQEQLKFILQSLGYNLLDRGKEWRTRPIYRDSNNNMSLRIMKDSGNWIDFGISQGGPLNKLIKITLGLTSLENANNWLKNNKLEIEFNNKIEDVNIDIEDNFSLEELNDLSFDYSYWISRGISKEIISLFDGGIFSKNVKSSMYNRFVFPIFNSQKKVLGYAGRWIMGDNNKVSKWKIIGSKEKFSFPLILNVKNIQEDRYLVLVESISDAISCFEVGYKNVLSLFGVCILPHFLCILLKLNPAKIYICLNNDKNNNYIGNKKSIEIKKQLLNFFDDSQIIIKTPEENDLNDMLMKNRNNLKNFLSAMKL